MRGLLKLVVLVLAAGAVGAAVGVGLSSLSQDDQPPAPVGGADPAAGETSSSEKRPSTTGSTATATVDPAPVDVPPEARTTTEPSPPRSTLRVSVLDARLFREASSSGREERRARMTVRIRAENPGRQRQTLDPPSLRVGSLKVQADAAAGAAGTGMETLEAGAARNVTLQFSLAGEVAPMVLRSRRARIFIADRLIGMRVKVRDPST